MKTEKLKNKSDCVSYFSSLESYNGVPQNRDILHVKEILGHKLLNNTMLYTQLISFKDDDFLSAVAHTEEEACKLIEAEFEYVYEFGQNKLFMKRN